MIQFKIKYYFMGMTIKNCDILVTEIYRHLRYIFTKKVFILSLIFVFISSWILIKDTSWLKFYRLSFIQVLILLSLIITLISGGIITHEFLHALMIKKYGGKVSTIDFCLLPFPGGFCDVSSLHFIKERIARFSVWTIGIYFWIIITIFFALMCKVFDQGIFFYLAICGFMATLTVINPFISSDGKEAVMEILRKRR